MANVLQVNEREAILTLAAQGWAIRRIARELKIHRHTVQRYLEQSKEGSKCTTISTAGKNGRKSLCEPHRQVIEEKTGQGLSAQRIYQDLKIEVQFAGSYESVKRLVRQLRKADPARVWRIEVSPGEEAQVDFGVKGSVLKGSVLKGSVLEL